MLRGHALDLRGKIKPLVSQGRDETGRKDVGEVREEHGKIQKKERVAGKHRGDASAPSIQLTGALPPSLPSHAVALCLGLGPASSPSTVCFLPPNILVSFQHFLHYQDRLGTISSSGSTPVLKENRRSPRSCVDSACRSA